MQNRPLRAFEQGAHLHVLDWAHERARQRFQTAGAVQVNAAARAVAGETYMSHPPELPSLEAALHGELHGLYALGHATVRSELAHQARRAPLPIGLSQPMLLDYNPDEPRDWHGRWGVGGILGDLSRLPASDIARIHSDVGNLPSDVHAMLAARGVQVVGVSHSRLGASFNPRTRRIEISPYQLERNPGQAPVVLHELGHAFDQAVGHISQDPGFRSLWQDAKPKTGSYYRRKHGASDPRRELFAEAAAHVWNGSEPSDFTLTDFLRELITELPTSERVVGVQASRDDSAPVTLARLPDLHHLRARARLATAAVAHSIHQVIARARLQGVDDTERLQVLGREAGDATLRAQASLHAGGAISAGRQAGVVSLLEHRPQTRIAGARYTAVLDANSCGPCTAADDGVLRSLDDPALVRTPNPACLGGSRCRCIWVYQLSTEPLTEPLPIAAAR